MIGDHVVTNIWSDTFELALDVSVNSCVSQSWLKGKGQDIAWIMKVVKNS
jgi:hypothetical protein